MSMAQGCRGCQCTFTDMTDITGSAFVGAGLLANRQQAGSYRGDVSSITEGKTYRLAVTFFATSAGTHGVQISG
jgi:hypothetical protein